MQGGPPGRPLGPPAYGYPQQQSQQPGPRPGMQTGVRGDA